nr:hypothetical protein [Tanacetum cinerariifolium]
MKYFDLWDSRMIKSLRLSKSVFGQITYFVASPTLDSANSYVMQGAFYTQKKVSYIPFVFSILFVLRRGGSMSPDSFLPSILLLVVIIIMVVVTVVVVVAVGGVPSRWTLKRASELLDSSGTGSLPNGHGMIHNELSNSATIDLLKGYSGGGVVDLTDDKDPTDEDRDIGMGDLIGVLVSLGGGISQESNIGDSDNTGDGGTIVGDGIDVKKDEEDKEEEHLAPADLSDVSTENLVPS